MKPTRWGKRSLPLLFACALALCSAAAQDASTLTGRVLDPQGLPVPNANLSLFDRNSGDVRHTASSAEGEYIFSGLSTGSYLIEASAEKMALTGSRQLVLDGHVNLDVQLGISGSAVEVVVSASGNPLSWREVAKAVDVIDSKEINLRDEFSLGEAIRNTPGVRVFQLAGPGSLTTVQTRGMRSYDTAVTIDGLRFRDASGTQGDAQSLFQDMNLVDTDRIEVLRGAGSTLYGTNAMAGVINISSNQGGGRPHGEIRAEGGGLSMLRGVAKMGGSLADDRFVYSGGFSHLNVVDGIRGVFPYRSTSGQAFAKYSFTPQISLSGRLWASGAFERSQNSPAFPASVTANFPAAGPVRAIALPADQLKLFEGGQPFSSGAATFVPSSVDPDAGRSGQFVSGALIFQHDLSPNASYRVSYQAVDSTRAFLDGPAGVGSFEPVGTQIFDYDGRIDTVQARVTARAGAYNLLNFGYEFEREDFKSSTTEQPFLAIDSEADILQTSHAVFGQDQIGLLNNQLQITLAGRAQSFELQDPFVAGSGNPYLGVEVESPPSAFTGDVSAAYFFPSSQTKLRGHLGSSYRAPSPYERFGSSFFQGFFSFYGDPRLKPERSIAFDGGIDQWFANSKVRLSATFFYTDLRQTIIFDFANFPPNDPFNRFGGYRNSGTGGLARGVELSGQFSPTSRTSLQASYTHTNSDQRTPTIGADFFEAPRASKHMFNFTATQWIAQKFNVTFDFFAASDYSESPFGALGRRVIFDGPIRGDVVFNYSVPVGEERSVDFYGKVQNVFNRAYYEGGFSSPRAWAIGGLKVNF